MEEDGCVAGKECAVKNKYCCPFGEESEELIEVGNDVYFVWRLVQFYDFHWNRSAYDEPVTYDVHSGIFMMSLVFWM